MFVPNPIFCKPVETRSSHSGGREILSSDCQVRMWFKQPGPGCCGNKRSSQCCVVLMMEFCNFLRCVLLVVGFRYFRSCEEELRCTILLEVECEIYLDGVRPSDVGSGGVHMIHTLMTMQSY